MSTIKVKIRLVHQNELVFDVSRDMLVGDLKKLIMTKTQIPVVKQRLIFSGRLFLNDKKISYYNVQDGDVIHMIKMDGVSNEQQNPPRPQNLQRGSQRGNRPFVQFSTMQMPNMNFSNINDLMSNVFRTISGNAPNNQNNNSSGNSQQRMQARPFNGGVMLGPFTQRNNPRMNNNNSNDSSSVNNPPENNQNNMRTSNVSNDTPHEEISRTVNHDGDVDALRDDLRGLMNNVNDREKEIRRFLKLSDKKKISSLSNSEKNELNELSRILRPFMRKLNITQQVTSTFERPRMKNKRPFVNQLTLHIHSSVGEMDLLPEKIKKLQNKIDIQNTTSTKPRGVITIVSESTSDNSGNSNIPNTIRERYSNVKEDVIEVKEENTGRFERRKKEEKKIDNEIIDSPDDILGSVLYGDNSQIEKEKKEKKKKLEKKDVEFNPDDILGSVLNEVISKEEKNEADDGPIITEVTDNTSTSPNTRPTPPSGQTNLFNLLSSQLSRPQQTSLPVQQSTNQPQNSTTNNNNSGIMDFANMLRSFQPILRDSLNPDGPNANRNVFSMLESMNNNFGILGDEDSEIDRIFNVALKNLNMREWLKVMSGDYSPLEKVKEPVREYMVNESFKKDISKMNRTKVVEKWLSDFEHRIVNNNDFKAIIKERVKPGVDFIQGLMEINRAYMTMVVYLILDGEKSKELDDIVVNIKEKKFSTFIKEIYELFIFDVIEFMYQNCRSGMGDVEKVLHAFVAEVMKGAPSNMRGMMANLSGKMTEQMAIKLYNRIKKKYPNRKPLRKSYQELFTDEKKEKKKEVEKERKRQEDMENEVIFRKEEIVKDVEDKKEPKKEERLKIKREKWMEGLSEKQIIHIVMTMAEDIEKEPVKHSKFSKSYLSRRKGENEEEENEEIMKPEFDKKKDKDDKDDEGSIMEDLD